MFTLLDWRLGARVLCMGSTCGGRNGRAETYRGARRARAQPQEHRRGHSARQARRDHRALGLGQVVPCLRHDLCGGPAALCRVALCLCAAVPRHDAEAGRGSHLRPEPRDLDRTEDDVEEPAVDRWDGDRDLRLPAPALRARRHALQPGDRQAHRGAAGTGHGRPADGDGGGDARLPPGPDHPRPEGRVPQGIPGAAQAGLPAREGGWNVSRAR